MTYAALSESGAGGGPAEPRRVTPASVLPGYPVEEFGPGLAFDYGDAGPRQAVRAGGVLREFGELPRRVGVEASASLAGTVPPPARARYRARTRGTVE